MPVAAGRLSFSSSFSRFSQLAFLLENDPSIHVRSLLSKRAWLRSSSSAFEISMLIGVSYYELEPEGNTARVLMALHTEFLEACVTRWVSTRTHTLRTIIWLIG